MQPTALPMRPVAVLALGLMVACVSEGTWAQADSASRTRTGTVSAVRPGIVFLGGIPHKIVNVTAGAETIAVPIPTLGMTPIQVGEEVIFAGPAMQFGDETLVDTRQGMVYRTRGKDMNEMMADMQSAIASQASTMPQDALPDAVPTQVWETDAQRKERSAEHAEGTFRWGLEILLLIVGTIAAVIAIQKWPRPLHRFTAWLGFSKDGRSKPPKGS